MNPIAKKLGSVLIEVDHDGETKALCPYTWQEVPLEAVALPMNQEHGVSESIMDREHVFPESIGGIVGYSVWTLKTANSTFGKDLDTVLAQATQIALLRVKYDLRGHSGNEPKANFALEGITTGVEATLTYAPSGTTTYVNKQQLIEDIAPDTAIPVQNLENPQDFEPGMKVEKSGTIVEGNSPKQRGMVLKGLIANKKYRRKTILYTKLTHHPEKEYRILEQFNDLRIRQALAKIAYIGVVCDSPSYVNDPLARKWVQYVNAETEEEANAVGLMTLGIDTERIYRALMPPLQEYEHAHLTIGCNPFAFLDTLAMCRRGIIESKKATPCPTLPSALAALLPLPSRPKSFCLC